MEPLEVEAPEEQAEESSPPYVPLGIGALVLVVIIVIVVLFTGGGDDSPPANSVGCPAVGDDTFEMTLPAYAGKTIQVPPPPTALGMYNYATDSAMVAMPKKCYDTYKGDITDSITLDDRQIGNGNAGGKGIGYARVSDITEGYEKIQQMLESCAFGLILSLHGTSGPTWDTVGAAVMFADFGFITVILDSQAMPDAYGLKGRLPHKATANITMEQGTCSKYDNNEGECSKFNKPYCYTTKVDNIVANPNYRKYMERLYTVKKMEVDYFVANHAKLLDAAQKVFLFGNSEGGMYTVRYHNDDLDKRMTGRIIYSAACDYNYFMPCAEAAQVCGHKCKDVPQLNLIGTADEFFGKLSTSTASRVAAHATGYGGPITGNCKAAYAAHGFNYSTVVEITDSKHGPLYFNDNVMRSVFADFVHTPFRDAAEWESLKMPSCELNDGVYTCAATTPTTCTKSYAYEPDATFEFSGVPPVGGCGTACQCPSLATQPFKMWLPASQERQTVEPQSLRDAGTDWNYATNEAMVVFPKACAVQYADNITGAEEIKDRQPGGADGMTYVRVSNFPRGYDLIADMLDTCACGLVISAHGTGGPGWDTVASATMFASLGYLVVMPDSQAMPDDWGLKGRLPLKPVDQINLMNWCGAFTGYDKSCSGFNKPYCYSSRAENILGNPDKYRQYTLALYTIRKREMDQFMVTAGVHKLLDKAKKLFLFGNSEGGVFVSKYHHANLDGKLKGRIVYSASCDFHYFTGCKDDAKVCGHQCPKDEPQLNLIGDEDNYFGRTSLASTVANDKVRGFGGPITGNCKAAYDEYNFTSATVVEVKTSGHGILYWNDNIMRGVLADFLDDSTKEASTWGSLTGCELVTGVYSCEPESPTTCKSISQAPWWTLNTPPPAFNNTGAPPNPEACASNVSAQSLEIYA